MTIVDTTVWIDFFRGTDTPEVRELQRLIDASEDVCICGVILTEVLQGIRDDKDHAAASAAFDAFLFLPMSQRTFIRAADLYRTLRRRGITIRNAVDCMIASAAIEHDIPLLHNDRDFDSIATLGNLMVVKTRERPTRKSSVSSAAQVKSVYFPVGRPRRSRLGRVCAGHAAINERDRLGRRATGS